MDLELKGKVAIVGGASKGLGRACADVLAQEGVQVTVCSRTEADLHQAAEEIRQNTGADVLEFPGDSGPARDYPSVGGRHGGAVWPLGHNDQQLRRASVGPGRHRR